MTCAIVAQAPSRKVVAVVSDERGCRRGFDSRVWLEANITSLSSAILSFVIHKWGNRMYGFRLLVDRATKLGIARPEYYIFPSCENLHIDATHPQKTWRTAWRNLTRAAGLKGLRFHDLRHQCITELLEGGAPEAAVLSIAGHVSRKMMEHYSHIRMEAKRKALEGLTPVVNVESESVAEEPTVN